MKKFQVVLLLVAAAALSAALLSCAKNPASPETASGTPTATPTITPTPSPTPIPAAGSFQNFEANNGTPEKAGNYFFTIFDCTCGFSSTVVNPSTGSLRGMSMTAQASGGTFGINPSTSLLVNLTRATKFYVWVYDTQGNNNLELKFHQYDGKTPGGIVSNAIYSSVFAVKNTWTKITWDLSGFTGIDKSQIQNIELYEFNPGLYYFDDAGWE